MIHTYGCKTQHVALPLSMFVDSIVTMLSTYAAVSMAPEGGLIDGINNLALDL